jgi:hypothetical protein
MWGPLIRPPVRFQRGKMEIIIRDKNKKYKQFAHRSGVEETIRKEWGTSGVTDAQLDRMKFIERQAGMNHSSVKAHVVDEHKEQGG